MIPSPREWQASMTQLQATASRFATLHAESDRYLTITAEPVRPDPYYPRNPSGWFYTGPITTLQGRRPDGLRDPWWLRAKAKRKAQRAARRRNRGN